LKARLSELEPHNESDRELSGEGGRSPLVLETNMDGSFAFQNLVAGQYTLKVSRGGYLENSRGLEGIARAELISIPFAY
jgi:hypothetical protein